MWIITCTKWVGKNHSNGQEWKMGKENHSHRKNGQEENHAFANEQKNWACKRVGQKPSIMAYVVYRVDS